MPFYAQYDPTLPGPAPVQGWYDTDFASYPNMPAFDHLLLLTQDQWNSHLAGGLWAVYYGTLVPYAPPPQPQTWTSYQATAMAALNDSDTTMLRIAEGVTLGLTTWTAADVVAWADYRRALRVIAGAASGTAGMLPAKPPYPAGT